MPYLVVDNAFNRANYPNLIGKTFAEVPGYAGVRKVITESKPSPWRENRGEEEETYQGRDKDQQAKRLPTRLGHGWDSQVYMDYTDAQIDSEAARIGGAGYHVALFKEGPHTTRIWYSEVASTDPLDLEGKVARWFDYRGR